MLNIKGLATDIFDTYLPFVNGALHDFCQLYWPCDFTNSKGRCINVSSRHVKGHQTQSGHIIGVGPYSSDFSFERYSAKWTRSLKRHITSLQGRNTSEAYSNAKTSFGAPDKSFALKVHGDAISTFYHSLGSATQFTHHGTCLCCLMGLPQYSLPCGHILCVQCVKLYGREHEGGVRTFKSCPLHPHAMFPSVPWPIGLKPDAAGVRILSLDG